MKNSNEKNKTKKRPYSPDNHLPIDDPPPASEEPDQRDKHKEYV